MKHVLTVWNGNLWAVFFAEKRGFHCRYFVKSSTCGDLIPTTKARMDAMRRKAK